MPPGSLLLSTRAPIGYVAEVSNRTAFNQGCRGLVPTVPVNVRYFRYQLSSLTERLNAWGQGSTFVELSSDALATFPLVVPSPAIQQTIADYLDRETSRIDVLIAAKRRMAKLLEERLAIYRRQLLMSPDHVLQPLKRTWRVVDCKHRTPTYVDQGYPVISPGDATPGRLEVSRAHRFVSEADYRDLTSAGRQPRKGDVIYSRNASIGIAAFVDTDKPVCMGQDVCLISSDHASQLFLTYFLNSLGLDQLEEQKVGSTFSRVNIAQILELIVPTPNPGDQRRIAQQLDEGTMSQQAVASRLETQIMLLRERRQALITAAVTGQLDIPEAA